MRSNRSRHGTKRSRASLIRLAYALAVCVSLTTQAHAAWITATFPAIVHDGADPQDLLGLGDSMAADDNLIVSIFIDTDRIDINASPARGAGALSVTITDTDTSRTAVFTDTGDSGAWFGTGSIFIPNTGTYYIEGHGGRAVSILLTLSLDDGTVAPALIEQIFTVSPGSGSGGTLQAYVTDSLTASVSFDFAQGNIEVPEPSGLALLGAGLLGLAGLRLTRLDVLDARTRRS